MSHFEEMTIGNVGDGSLAAAFDAALQRVASDLDDPAKDPKAKRKITATVSFKPDGEGNLLIAVDCDAVLPRRCPTPSAGFADGGGILQLRNTQEALPLGTVTPLRDTHNG